MKKTIFILFGTMAFTAGTLFMSCQSSNQKPDAALVREQGANQDVNAAQRNANKSTELVATAEEWETFRNESELKVKANETQITDLNVKMKKPGETFDEAYGKKITKLEEQNKEMSSRLIAYDKDQSNWESFKREFNRDMDEIGKSLKDLTVDNKR